jgi:hypothetical protein
MDRALLRENGTLLHAADTFVAALFVFKLAIRHTEAR